MKLPKISVITPSYNQGSFIEETILSVINQNYQNVEYIIIDGGSTDNTLEIIKKYEKYISYSISEKDNGQSDAINKGFKIATGEIICWLNSDDIYMPNTLNTVAKYFEADKNLDLINGNTVIIDKNSTIINAIFILKHKKHYALNGIFYINQPSMFWKRKINEKLGFLNVDYHAEMDREFLIRVFENNYKIGQVNEILSAFRMHEMAKSAGNSTHMYLRDKDELIKVYNGKYPQDPNIFIQLVYGLEKFIKGIYFKKWKFVRQWKGKNINQLYSFLTIKSYLL